MMSILASTLALLVADATWKDNISREGWVQLRDGAETVLLVKRSSAPSTFWLRSETEISSAAILMRYDCSAWTIQIAQSFNYSRPNMTGEIEASSTPSAADVPPPNSLLDTLLTTICEA